MGVARIINARSSINEPPTRYTAMIITIIKEGCNGRLVIQSAATKGISVTARKWPRTVEPAMSKRTIQAVRNDSSIDLSKPLNVNSLLAAASAITAKVPILPASVGENHPHINPPITTRKIIATHMNSGRA